MIRFLCQVHSMASHHIKIRYWPVRARITLPVVVMHAHKIHYEWVNAADWPVGKEETPFGQLPVLEDGHIKLGQSLAIARYLGRRAGILGDNDADFAASEQLIQQFEDIFNALSKAHNTAPRGEHMKKALDETVHAQLSHVEKLAHGQTITGKVLLGDLAIWTALYIIVTDLRHDYLEHFPKLKAFYHHLAEDPNIKTIHEVKWGAYLKAHDD